MIYAWSSKDKILASYRDDQGRLSVKKIGDARYLAYQQDGDRWNELEFINYEERKRALALDPGLFEADVTPVRRFMTDNPVKIERPRRAYTDIETDSRVPPRVQADTSPGRILSMGVIGEDKKRTCLVLEEDSDEAERFMLEEYWKTIAEYDQITGWYSKGFDEPVIKNRSELLLRNSDVYWRNMRRIMWVCMLEAKKKYNTASESGEEKSNKLGDYARVTIGVTKLEFDASKTYAAWEEGGARRAEMVDYMMRDVELLPPLDAKAGHLEILQTLCEMTTAFPNNQGISPMTHMDAIMLRKARKAGIRLPSKIHRDELADDEKPEGAIVLESTMVGIEKNVHVCDFTSLYPSIIRTWNIGHETKGGIGCIAPGTGISFANDVQSLLAEVLVEGMDGRDHWKKLKKTLPKGSPEWKEADRKDNAHKVFNNSFYGLLGNIHGRYFDPELIESVTLTGQWLIKTVVAEAERRGMTAKYGDTDSLFVSGSTKEEFDRFVNDCNTTVLKNAIMETGVDPGQYFNNLDFEKTFDRIVVPQGNTGEPSKKRYCGSYSGGKPVRRPGEEFNPELHSKPEIKGIEYKRGDATGLARTMMETSILYLLGSKIEDPNFFEEWINSEREKLIRGAVKLSDLTKSAAISKPLKAYKVSGAPGHVRVAREMEAAGEDVSEGTRIAYIVVDGSVSPAKVVSVADYVDGTFDRRHYWNKLVYPPTLRLLAGAFPNRNWKRWLLSNTKKGRILPGQMGLGL